MKYGNFSSIRFSVNGREFYAEGDAAEVKRKLDEFMAGVFRPVREVVRRANAPSWRTVLGVKSVKPTMREVEKRFRRLSKLHHPDKGGDPNKFRQLVEAREAAKLELSA